MKKIIYSYGRPLKKLRFSINEVCNLNCTYCMPPGAVFSPLQQSLSKTQITDIASRLSKLGVDEIRITGGEPTLRQDFMSIMKSISSLDIKSLGLTTNGVFTEKYLPELWKQTKCRKINFSLDSLNPQIYKRICKQDALHIVLSSILKARELGFVVKINTVLMKDINHQEIDSFINFSSVYDIEVRFLELMNIGVAKDKLINSCVRAEYVESEILKKYQMKKIETSKDSTAYKFKLSNGAVIGFIASESKPFCKECTRLRVNYKGEVRACLMVNKHLSLVDKNLSETEEILCHMGRLKPLSKIEGTEDPMYQVGG
ncbi:MAG: radical SAM protein [Bacteriovoracaceae bacterium]|nr:radical SAM protein [Bacteriovoracaceae bacterium]